MKLIDVKIHRLHLQLNDVTSQMLYAELLYRFALIVISDNTFTQFCRLGYVSTYSRAYTIQTIDTAQVDVSDAKRSGFYPRDYNSYGITLFIS